MSVVWTEGRAVGRCTVTCLLDFLGWVVYHVFLPMVLRCARFARESSAIKFTSYSNLLIKCFPRFERNPHAGFFLAERHRGVKLGTFDNDRTYFRTKGISTKSENPILKDVPSLALVRLGAFFFC